MSALAFYNKAPKVDEAAMQTWTDLCPNGEAKLHSGKPPTLGDPWIPNTLPCTGTKLGDSPYNGWSFNSGTRTWTASKDTASGTYFVHQADVANGTGNGSIPNITVIASAEGTGCTDKQYGNIVWDHYDTPAPAFTNLFFMADGDLSATSNFYSGQSSPRERGLRDVRRGGGDPRVDQLQRAGRGRPGSQPVPERHGSGGQQRGPGPDRQVRPEVRVAVLQPDLHNPLARIRGLSPNH